jgi:hypothetical protein
MRPNSGANRFTQNGAIRRLRDRVTPEWPQHHRPVARPIPSGSSVPIRWPPSSDQSIATMVAIRE